MKTKTNILCPAFTAFTFLCFALAPRAPALVPPPDGGYPGGNTAEGQAALLSLTTGAFNTAVGYLSLRNNTSGQFNTAIGAGTLLVNVGNPSSGEGTLNTATGAGALLSNTTGAGNTASGAFALFTNTSGSGNVANGNQALLNNTTGSENTANGLGSLLSNTTGRRNTATGHSTLNFNTTGIDNTANGYQALLNNTTGSDNTANGVEALAQNTTGNLNTATGELALVSNSTGSSNTADGFEALSGNTIGVGNTAIGRGALLSNGASGFNTAVGINALVNNGSGRSNTALGDFAGFNVTNADHVICIGANVQGENVSNTCYIGSIFGVTSAGGAGVFVNANGKLGTATSSSRFKNDIKPMDNASETLFALKPVTFRYKKEIDPQGMPQFGLIAEDVEKLNPTLVVHDKEGKPYSVRYDQVNAMLVNEFLKEHTTVQELKKQVAALTAAVKEQAQQIQKVSAHIEIDQATPELVSSVYSTLSAH